MIMIILIGSQKTGWVPQYHHFQNLQLHMVCHMLSEIVNHVLKLCLLICQTPFSVLHNHSCGPTIEQPPTMENPCCITSYRHQVTAGLPLHERICFLNAGGTTGTAHKRHNTIRSTAALGPSTALTAPPFVVAADAGLVAADTARGSTSGDKPCNRANGGEMAAIKA